MMHTSPLLFRLTADCTLELPPTRTISLTQCCYRDELGYDLSKDFCRFHHLEPAEVNTFTEIPIWYPKPIVLSSNGLLSIPIKPVNRYEEKAALKSIFFKHMLANVKDYLSKIQEHFMSSAEENYSSNNQSERESSPDVSGDSQAPQSEGSQRGNVSATGRSGWAQNLATGVSNICNITPAKITEFLKSVWHGFEVMGLTEDNTVG